MSVFRVSSRYAKSLVDLSIEKGVLEGVREDMNRLLAIGTSNKEFVSAIKSPVIKGDKKLKVLKALFPNGNELTLAFFDILSKKGRESLLLDIAKAFVNLYNEHRGIQVAEVTTTFAMDDKQREEFKKIVKQISNKQEVELIEKVNKDIIGGFVLKVGDRQLDESLNSKLNALRLQFSQNLYEKHI
ncbi:ATP synthase F1 subunit delta [Litoribacter alkaliphilus]|uniref:ATP synthase subunit delta n=1 Tax=Litoribacter ruber TaxID=702568 RepID=A0AAP2CGH8_9BACT|nr:ATP synthase F1 subunit delta [Litoribacter alkaliphilus]MBS9524208.1 ATP synthase F1 subunit delta [Litoribacter alkaliphilus]